MASRTIFVLLFCCYFGNCFSSPTFKTNGDNRKDYDTDPNEKAEEDIAQSRIARSPEENVPGIHLAPLLTRAIPLVPHRKKRDLYKPSYGSQMYSGSGGRYQGSGVARPDFSSSEYSGQYAVSEYPRPSAEYSPTVHLSYPKASDSDVISADDQYSDRNDQGSSYSKSSYQQPIIYIVSVPVPVPSSYYPTPYALPMASNNSAIPYSYAQPPNSYMDPTYSMSGGQYPYGSVASSYGSYPSSYGYGPSSYGSATSIYGSVPSGYGSAPSSYGSVPSSYGYGPSSYSSSQFYSPSSYNSYSPYSPSTYGSYGGAGGSYGSYNQPYGGYQSQPYSSIFYAQMNAAKTTPPTTTTTAASTTTSSTTTPSVDDSGTTQGEVSGEVFVTPS